MEENRNDITPEEAVREYRRELSRKGGKAIMEKYGRSYMRELGKKSAAKRWPKDRFEKLETK